MRTGGACEVNRLYATLSGGAPISSGTNRLITTFIARGFRHMTRRRDSASVDFAESGPRYKPAREKQP
jgi:hypothetical protein